MSMICLKRWEDWVFWGLLKDNGCGQWNIKCQPIHQLNLAYQLGGSSIQKSQHRFKLHCLGLPSQMQALWEQVFSNEIMLCYLSARRTTLRIFHFLIHAQKKKRQNYFKAKGKQFTLLLLTASLKSAIKTCVWRTCFTYKILLQHKHIARFPEKDHILIWVWFKDLRAIESNLIYIENMGATAAESSWYAPTINPLRTGPSQVWTLESTSVLHPLQMICKIWLQSYSPLHFIFPSEINVKRVQEMFSILDKGTVFPIHNAYYLCKARAE